jgi:hypothetical protein
VLDDQDVFGEQTRVHAATRVVRVVDVPEVDADESGPAADQKLERVG